LREPVSKSGEVFGEDDVVKVTKPEAGLLRRGSALNVSTHPAEQK
jgi:hypothetical protein